MKPYIRIAIRTKQETAGWNVGERFIETLTRQPELLTPELVSQNPDKITEPFAGKAACQALWAPVATLRANGALSEHHQDFAWRRKKALKSTGSVVHSLRNIRGQVVPADINFHSVVSDKVDWCALFKDWCTILAPQLAMLHLFDGPEIDPALKTRSFQLGSFNAALKPDVPNMGWAMFYGDEFAEQVDAERIAAAGFPVERMGSGYLVRVTDSLGEVASDFARFSSRRAELKRLFREDFCLVRDEPAL